MRTATEPREIKVKTVERTLMLLEIMAEQSRPLTLTRLSQLSHLSVSTTYRLLSTLNRSGFVEREKISGEYKLGIKAFLIGNAAMQAIDQRSIAMPILNRLARECDGSVYLAMLSGPNVIYTDNAKTSGPLQIGIQTGIPIPACKTCSGKVLLAYANQAEQARLAGIYREDQLIHDLSSFFKDLHEIGERGYHTEISAFGGGIRELSVPLFDRTQACTGAVSVFRAGSGANLSDADQSLLEKLISTGREISKAMGCPQLAVRSS